ncbi:Uncharacterised protein [Chryseobacterium nakagawai]|uniref:Uncharacterized protein n=1 Tax=Chryseobacterium nakagawai TaxID=1241982 RepID=A0AAD1DRG3_CHRNA|nr:hypothetical protein [Chryseobacterium nakagawai]AZA91761.1 hypothetical protein EG343_14625 [Chryseobacterium nakagawai]VEH18268.1 Uncharacterised protein [Chryseobacterium nakagawai]
MKGKTFITNKNINIKDLNFIVKKDNTFYVKDTYILKSGLEMAKLQFGQMKGVYRIPRFDIQTLLDTNSLRLPTPPIFQINQIVFNNNKGRGIILGAEYDPVLEKCWIYRVLFDNYPSVKYKIFERDLQPSN